MTFKPKHILRWREQVNYTGENFDQYFIAYWRFFRCTPMDRANFKYIKEHLLDCGTSPGQIIFPAFTDEVQLCRYYILIHEDAERALKMADMFGERVHRKGSLDPELEQAMNWAGICKSWRLKSLQGKVDICKEAGVSIFAARRYTPNHELLAEVLAEAT